jgi:predicted small lipoprotein YifL
MILYFKVLSVAFICSLALCGCGIKGKLEHYEEVENSLYDK